MDTDDFRLAWAAFDRRLERQEALGRRVLAERSVARARNGLRPLLIGQSLQAAAGLAMAIVAGMFWTAHLGDTALLVSGLIVHLYGIAMIVLAAPAILLLARVDPGRPVAELQRRLALLRFRQRRSAVIFGYAGCIAWVPMMLMIAQAVFHVDLYAVAPWIVHHMIGWSVIAVGVLFGLHRWIARHAESRFARFVDRSRLGRSLQRAGAVVDELERFLRDEESGVAA